MWISSRIHLFHGIYFDSRESRGSNLTTQIKPPGPDALAGPDTFALLRHAMHDLLGCHASKIETQHPRRLACSVETLIELKVFGVADFFAVSREFASDSNTIFPGALSLLGHNHAVYARICVRTAK